MRDCNRPWLHAGLVAAAALRFAPDAQASAPGCSRPIVVPAAAVGASFIIGRDGVDGVFPEMLRAIGPRAGCSFEFVVVPRARAEFMVLKAGTGDLLMPATRTRERDLAASFVALTVARPTLYSLKDRRWTATSLRDLLAWPGLRGVTVRSYNWGDDFAEFLRALEAQGRLESVNDLEAATRMLLAGRADFTVVAPSQVAALREQTPALAGALDRLRADALGDLPPVESGVYVSRLSLPPADQAHLRQVLLDAVRNGDFRRANERHYAPEILRGPPAPRAERR